MYVFFFSIHRKHIRAIVLVRQSKTGYIKLQIQIYAGDNKYKVQSV